MSTDKSFIVDVNGKKSNCAFDIKNGLQQGTVTSPLLFIIYISELISSLQNTPGKNYTNAFPDDITIDVVD